MPSNIFLPTTIITTFRSRIPSPSLSLSPPLPAVYRSSPPPALPDVSARCCGVFRVTLSPHAGLSDIHGAILFLQAKFMFLLRDSAAFRNRELGSVVVYEVPRPPLMAYKINRHQTEALVTEYLLSDTFIPYTSVLAGLLMCRLVYDLTRFLSSLYFKGYNSLTKIQRLEWNNRGMSSVHAIFITSMSIYLVFFAKLFSDDHLKGLVTFRWSNLSTFTLGVSVGYFISDLAMIFWLYPLLGGLEYVLHHALSLCAISYAMLTGEGQLYTYMVLISETTTPGINIRWYLDTAGMKRSNAYLVNGVIMFLSWLVARIFLFVYLFYHVYLHYDQVMQMHMIGYLLVFVVPSALAIMNLMWFGKILKGLRKTLAKRQ